jgi:hypothetical protein
MTTPAEEIGQRLALLAHSIEEHATAIWLAEWERDELRQQLRVLNAKSMSGVSADDLGTGRSQTGFRPAAGNPDSQLDVA